MIIRRITVVLLAAITIMVSFIGYEQYQSTHKFSLKEHADLSRAASSFAQIDTIMKPVLEKYHSNRVTLFRLHSVDNSDLSTLPSFDLSVANIQTANGTEARIDQLQQLPAGIFGSILNEVIQTGSAFRRVDSMQNTALKQLLQSRGTEAAIWFAVRDNSNQVIGLLATSWQHYSDVPKDNDFQIMTVDMMEVANKLGLFFGLPHLQ